VCMVLPGNKCSVKILLWPVSPREDVDSSGAVFNLPTAPNPAQGGSRSESYPSPRKGAGLEGIRKSQLKFLPASGYIPSSSLLGASQGHIPQPHSISSIRTNRSRFFKQLLDILTSFPDILTCRSPLYYILPSDNLSLYCSTSLHLNMTTVF
jgi:hypothetical protein